jgi:hypothetical protein
MGNLGSLERLGVGPGWEEFGHPDRYVHAALVLLTATISGLILAFHPVQLGRPLTRDDIEQRKTVVFYSSVGALIAIICTVAPSMAFVIFGIGGLMRFRTNTGESKATGHTIMGTLIGLCWGLGPAAGGGAGNPVFLADDLRARGGARGAPGHRCGRRNALVPGD